MVGNFLRKNAQLEPAHKSIPIYPGFLFYLRLHHRRKTVPGVIDAMNFYVGKVQEMNSHTQTKGITTVFFDGSCPLCRREVSVYQHAVPSTPIEWVDVSVRSEGLTDGPSCGELMARFHVQTAEGVLLSGAAAFVSLWLLFPGWRWLGKFGSLPGMPRILELTYRGFLVIRPGIQWIFRRMEARHTPQK
ncbi:DUF393 domain-containing protein [Herbaspirillum sp. RTI4]|uniref:thiol-disulfide oxidoreductase DCC family protein n=1 Tax=Herbaspirillum sp. RTI4 TaxID=3048640 RepID=UPI002AB465F9|nr:DUF393 domain-containing protein [Herbaspirillum sp. RTI4]MDY7578798.1 DUF393 domain-containing protein [Herbaspirillum sp. RTI4]MEA9982281.1 DUF393 domain-containing protein [Herbaspirillum sp. RTI4]